MKQRRKTLAFKCSIALFSRIQTRPGVAFRVGFRSTRSGPDNKRNMPLTTTDWAVIIGYLLINLVIGIYYRRRSSGDTAEFFVSGRDVSWWLAGTSMVATTFAADTPLFVSGELDTQGIAGNWIWGTSCLGGMLTVFFFARYWRRAEVLTDVELTEIRYGGKPAAFLRGFKAVYLGLIM